jgi:hypothetical protein
MELISKKKGSDTSGFKAIQEDLEKMKRSTLKSSSSTAIGDGKAGPPPAKRPRM